MEKTNAVRILMANKIEFALHDYSSSGFVSAKDTANYLKIPEEKLFKTLVCKGKNNYYVFVIPANSNLDLKKASKIVGEKKVEMIHQKELYPLTGYVHGGCSPIGMKKHFKTFVDQTAKNLQTFCISGGEIGLSVELNPNDLQKIINFAYFDLTCDREKI